MKRVINYLVNLTKQDSEESSKRFIALYIILVIVTVITFKHTNKHNFELILGEFLAFVAVLLGVATWLNSRKRSNDENKNKKSS